MYESRVIFVHLEISVAVRHNLCDQRIEYTYNHTYMHVPYTNNLYKTFSEEFSSKQYRENVYTYKSCIHIHMHTFSFRGYSLTYNRKVCVLMLVYVENFRGK